jgi:DNA polymerase-3 subunit gamma/tau
LAQQLSPEAIQVYYQLLIQGKRDLPLASDPQAGFEMVCLRLMAFRPVTSFDQIDKSEEIKKNVEISLPELDESPNQLNEVDALTVELKDVDNTPRDEQTDTSQIPNQAASSNSLPEVETEKSSEPIQSYPDYESRGDLEDDEQALLNQQAFYQDMANSLGFQDGPSEKDSEALIKNESETVVTRPEHIPQQPPVESDDELENPVLAILANRGLLTGDSSQSSVPQDIKNASSLSESNQSETTSDASNDNDDSLPKPKRVEVTRENDAIDQDTATEQEVPELLDLEHEEVRFAHQVDNWAALIEQSHLAGLGRQLALNSEVKLVDGRIELIVKQEFAHLLNDNSEADLYQVVEQIAPGAEFRIDKSEVTLQAPSDIQKNININRQERAEQSIQDDVFVQSLMQGFDGKVLPGSIKPL